MKKKTSYESIAVCRSFKRLLRAAAVALTFLTFFVVLNTSCWAFSCGEENTGGKKILIAYDTRHGSTSAVSETIGAVLCGEGFQVEADLAYKISDISSYDAVIIGSPIYWATLQPDIKSFMSGFKDTLSGKPVALFVVCSTIDEETGLVDPAARGYFVNSTLEEFPDITFLEPVGLFGGVIDLKKLFPFEFLNMSYTGYAVGDFRAASAPVVLQWAETVAELFR